MQATDESPSRFEVARKEALSWVDSLRPDDKMVVLQAAANTEVKQSETGEKAALRRAILSCKALDSPTRLAPALKMAESLVRDRGPESNPEIHLFSDGAIPDLEGFDNKGLPVVYHRVGHSGDNLGITALDVRPNPEDPSKRVVYVTIENFSTNTLETSLELRFDGALVAPPRDLKIPAGASSPQVFFAAQTKDGVFTVRSTLEDDLAADNEASIVSLLPHPVKVLLVTHGNRLLEKALRAAPDVQLTVADDLTDPGSQYDLVALDCLSPTVWPAGNVLAIHTWNTNWFDKVSEIEAPAIVDWRATHPILRYVGFDNVQIAKGFLVKTPTWGISLVDSTQAPLIIAGELGRQRIIWVGFDTLESNWPLRISFPIFIANASDWLNPATARNAQLLVHAGDAFRFGLSQPVNSAQVTLPNGTTESIQVGTNANEVVFGDTFKQGVYRLKAGTNNAVFCVALLDSAESNIKPRDELKFGKYNSVTATTLHRTNLELWRHIAALALVVILFEWWYYHRRTV